MKQHRLTIKEDITSKYYQCEKCFQTAWLNIEQYTKVYNLNIEDIFYASILDNIPIDNSDLNSTKGTVVHHNGSYYVVENNPLTDSNSIGKALSILECKYTDEEYCVKDILT